MFSSSRFSSFSSLRLLKIHHSLSLSNFLFFDGFIEMTTEALRDHNTLPGSERRNGSSSKDSLPKSYIENNNENLEKRGSAKPTSVATPVKEEEIGGNGVEVGVVEVEYVDSEHLNDVEDVDTVLSTLLAGLDSKDWVLLCEALNNARRLSIFHKEAIIDTLGNVISLVVKSLKNPRSAVCKTAIMTSEDIFKAYGDTMIDSLDPLLVQLLLKSSQDKRFVCEAAEKALVAMTTRISSTILLPKVIPHLKHRNPRIRAKASSCFCRSVLQLGKDGINAFGIDKLIQAAAPQLTDQLPESREAARILLLELRTVYESTDDPLVHKDEYPTGVLLAADCEQGEIDLGTSSARTWENFCFSKLNRLSAEAVIRVTKTAKLGHVVSS